MVNLPKSEECFCSLVLASGLLIAQVPHWSTLITRLKQEGWHVQYQCLSSAVMPNLQTPPDLIVLIDDSPGYSWAIPLCSALQVDPAIASAPAVILGKDDSAESALQALQAGAVDIIRLSISIEEAIARLSHHARQSRQVAALTQQNQHLYDQVEKARQIEESLRIQAAQEKMFTELTQRIRQSLDLSTILKAAVQEVRQLLTVDRVLVYRFNSDWSGEIALESVSSQSLSILGAIIHDPCFENHWNRRYASGRVCVLNDVRGSSLKPCYRDLLESLKVRANLVLPILQQETLWGLLIVHQCIAARTWQSWEVELLQKLSAQLAIAIQQSELYYQLQTANQELERLANLDSLTQVANRRQFDRYITQEWRRLQREQTPISMLLCDIDYFKQYNDSYGHQSGDDCLRQVAQAIASVVKRPADLVARYGGEEFSVILPNTLLEGATEVATKIQAAVAQLAISRASANENTYVTLSIGIASMVPSVRSTPDRLIAAADQALYAAKAQGRNRYCVWNPR